MGRFVLIIIQVHIITDEPLTFKTLDTPDIICKIDVNFKVFFNYGKIIGKVNHPCTNCKNVGLKKMEGGVMTSSDFLLGRVSIAYYR